MAKVGRERTIIGGVVGTLLVSALLSVAARILFGVEAKPAVSAYVELVLVLFVCYALWRVWGGARELAIAFLLLDGLLFLVFAWAFMHPSPRQEVSIGVIFGAIGIARVGSAAILALSGAVRRSFAAATR